MKEFILEENSGVSYYTVPAFTKTGLVIHGFSTRLGGISQKPFDTLNLGFHTGDEFEAVKKNRQLFAKALSIDATSIVTAHQVHGDKIFQADIKDKGRGALDRETVIKDTDALITDKPGLALTAFFADCVPIVFLDPVRKVIAMAHAGWKGTVLKIGQKTVRKMKEEYGSQPQDILAAIGPSIGPCHYEVDTPVIEKFKENFNYANEFLIKQDGQKAQLDLWRANYLQLLEVGLNVENISVAEICTFCHPEILFSYRYNNGKTGRLAALIMLK